MELYCTPGGQWAGTEKDWKAHMKAEGLDPKTYTGRRKVDVPVKKAELLEFLTFHTVNVIGPRRVAAGQAEVVGGATAPLPAPPAAPAPTPDLDKLFEASPISNQLRLAVGAIDRADALLSKS